ncbi:DUF4394 domain-containing protein [Streptomyces scabiei]|nr:MULTISPECIES: DUF4394 domain-containing protein [Streptomyces]MDW8478275.1 DUF4394 domain-containing protein [Streptomyces scabiei]MDX2565761.1 DUF4394 domain-containing protein [Streptomyces scabiei]MDX2577000.1 DUF4394 domain-containing protein [Streptomyces scabiei]MDX2630183.1 DUF4394 domain-containing protein [Streptomyces scabiei]MDX2656744.1 DUF4394 domain-containing protein [Streptomyces scabiei]
MRKRVMAAFAVVLAASCAAPALAFGSVPASAGGGGLTAIGLTESQRLVEFDVDRPAHAWSLGKISGLAGDSRLVGIDFRVQNGKLYGVGDRGGIYTLDARAKARKVSQLTVALSGTAFGVDFNPAANRLRVVSDTGQNLRHNIDDPAAPLTTTVDGTLTNPTTPPSTARGVTGAAYTNNDLSTATATTLFDLDTMADRISLQSPANAGTLAPTGNLGVDAALDAGFDIYYHPTSGTNRGFAAIATAGVHRLYGVNLLTGKATDKGSFPKKFQVTDLALPIDQK